MRLRTRPRAVRWAAVLLVVASAAPLAAAGSASAAATDAAASYDFEPVTDVTGIATVLANGGRAAVETSVVTAYGGGLASVGSRATQGSAVQFPAFNPAGSGARAVIKVVNTTGADQLAPGTQDFSWSADFRLDADTESSAKGSHDNGNNLLQRGLFGDTQFKLDVDDRRPSCRLRGSTGDTGAVRVRAPMTVTADQWYNATCTRAGNTLTVAVRSFDATGNVTQQWSSSATSSAGFGSVTWAKVDTPLSIGGKLSATGKLPGYGDQFNGAVDNAVLRFDAPA